MYILKQMCKDIFTYIDSKSQEAVYVIIYECLNINIFININKNLFMLH